MICLNTDFAREKLACCRDAPLPSFGSSRRGSKQSTAAAEKTRKNHGDAFTRYQSNLSTTRILPTQCTPQPKCAANFANKRAIAPDPSASRRGERQGWPA
jgi:hypothetical protein